MGRFQDQLRILGHTSPSKARNAWRLWRSYRRSVSSGNVVHRGMPMSISVEPTTACNLRCPECPSGLRQFSRPTGNLSADLAGELFRELRDSLIYANLYFQGEPLIHPGFFDIVEKGKENGIYMSTSTNAHFLSEKKAQDVVRSGLDRLIISIDGLTQETYSNYRKEGKLDKVIEGTRNVIAAKRAARGRTPHVIFQFLVTAQNEHEIPQLFKLAKELGVDEVKLKTIQVYDYEDGNPLLPTNEKYSRYHQGADGKYSLRNSMDDECWRMWSGCVVTWDGRVVPCCFDKDAKHSLGQYSPRQANFQEIWTSERYQAFRRSVFTDRSAIDICKNCSEGSKVWA